MQSGLAACYARVSPGPLDHLLVRLVDLVGGAVLQRQLRTAMLLTFAVLAAVKPYGDALLG